MPQPFKTETAELLQLRAASGTFSDSIHVTGTMVSRNYDAGFRYQLSGTLSSQWTTTGSGQGAIFMAGSSSAAAGSSLVGGFHNIPVFVSPDNVKIPWAGGITENADHSSGGSVNFSVSRNYRIVRKTLTNATTRSIILPPVADMAGVPLFVCHEGDGTGLLSILPVTGETVENLTSITVPLSQTFILMAEASASATTTGRWIIAGKMPSYSGSVSSGGGGVTSHALLTAGTLVWGSSAHSGSANSVATFDIAGAAAVVTASDNNTLLTRRSGSLQFAKVDLQNDVTGVLPAANGGGGTSNHTALSNLSWTSSAHTGSALSVATFDVGGVAAVVTASENNTVLARRSNEFLFSKLNLATETTGSLPASQGGVGARPRPVFSVKGIEWMANNGEASTTVDALAGSRVHYSLHHEEDLNGHTYDAISAVVTAGATTSSLALYSYNEATGQPGVLLWQSVTGTNPASHIMVFASGTWDAASSVGYKNGSNQLVLTCSMTVVKAALGSGNTTWRTLNATQTRNIGTSTDIVTGYTGWTENVVWPTFSPTASVSDLSTPNVSTVLRWIS